MQLNWEDPLSCRNHFNQTAPAKPESDSTLNSGSAVPELALGAAAFNDSSEADETQQDGGASGLEAIEMGGRAHLRGRQTNHQLSRRPQSTRAIQIRLGLEKIPSGL